MNEMKPLEEQLRSLSPRRPSPDLKVAVFGEPSQPGVSRGQALSWFMPVTACVLLALTLTQTLTRDGLLRGSGTGSVPLFAAIGSNSVANLLSSEEFFVAKADGNVQWNVWDKATFRWTNEHLWTSSMGSLQLAKTNHLQ